MNLAERCLIHAEKMQGEGWYVTANVLAAAAERLGAVDLEKEDELTALIEIVDSLCRVLTRTDKSDEQNHIALQSIADRARHLYRKSIQV